MKYFRFLLFVAAVLAFSTAAYAQQPITRATVPFNDAHSGLALTTACSVPKGKGGQTKLVVARVGGVYFLHQIWVAGSQANRELRPTPKEATLAENGPAPQEVVVAAILVRR